MSNKKGSTDAKEVLKGIKNADKGAYRQFGSREFSSSNIC
jgi:hypothetical protein